MRIQPIRLAHALSIALLAIMLAACSGAQDSSSERQANEQAQRGGPVTVTATAAATSSSQPAQQPATPTAEPTVVETATAQPTETVASTPESTPIPSIAPTSTPETTPEPTPTPTPEPLPASAYLEPMTHAFQTWNNCSAVSASMALSYFGITMSQEELATVFRPNLNDKHVEAPQLVEFFPKYGIGIRLLEGGTVDRVKALLAEGFPVITPQWLDFDPDAIGHYRIVRGYDDARGGFLVNDSMTGANVLYPYGEFEQLWRAFNFRYLPLFWPEDEPRVLQILGPDADETVNLQNTLARVRAMAEQSPDDAYLWFSVGTGHFELGQYAEAITAYERAASIGLPPKMLWYQFWPVTAYNEVGNHQRAAELATIQINDTGTFGEMRYERGRAYEAQGQIDLAIADYRQALVDDANLDQAQAALDRLGV